jgi:hypothetical protein
MSESVRHDEQCSSLHAEGLRKPNDADTSIPLVHIVSYVNAKSHTVTPYFCNVHIHTILQVFSLQDLDKNSVI